MNIDLLNYIEQARKSGMGDEQIRQGLFQSGWSANDINEAMMKAPATVIPQPRSRTVMSKTLAIIFIFIAVGVGGYFAGAYYMANYQDLPLWPFEVSVVPLPTFTPRPIPRPTSQSFEGQFCGGIAAIACPEGYECILDGQYPDAGGSCAKLESPSTGSGQSAVPADWQTYRNEEYGFEFKYPGDWIARISTTASLNVDYPAELVEVSSSSAGFGENIIVLRTTVGIQDINGNLEYIEDIRKNTNYFISNLPALSKLSLDNPKNFVRSTAVVKENLVYIIGQIYYGDENSISQSKLIFDQILSTFKFTR